jgi:alkylation response protein AidB-like acyl-CoA dehydrogenase
MNLDFTDEQNMMRDAASKFFVNECSFERVKELEESEDGYDPNLWQQMAELGWLGLMFPEKYGGLEMGFLDLMVVLEEMGKRVFPSPFFSTVVQCGTAILEGGSEAQKEDLIAGIAEGSLIMAWAQYEPEGSYKESGIQMKAEAQGDNYVLNGTKMFVMDANVAQKLIVAARADGMGVSLFVVDAKDPGITCTKMPTIGKDNTCEVIFKDVKAPKDAILGTPGTGWDIIEKMNIKAAIAKAAEMIGGCKTCVDMTSEYAKQREQYGKPIGGFQIIQHYMANMLLAYDTIYEYLYRVACLVDQGEDCALEASVLKAAANENYKFIADRCVQIHGGIGTSREYDAGLFFRKCKTCEVACGDTDFHHARVLDGISVSLPAW